MADSAWPPASGLSTPTVSSKDATFHTYARTRIHAPASLVFDTVLHVAAYPQWNKFVPEVRILSQPPSAEPAEAHPNDASHLRNGTVMTFMVIMDSKKPEKYTKTELQVSDISTPERPSEYIDLQTLEREPSYTADLSTLYRVSWKQHGGYASKGLKTERFHEIIVVGDNECELRTWEVYGGVLAYTVKWLYQKTLSEKFELWGQGLKMYSEQRVAKGAVS